MNPAMRAACDYAVLHPDEVQTTIAARFAVPIASLRTQLSKERKRAATGKTEPQRTQERVVAKSKLISLGKPEPKVAAVPDELTRLVQDAMAVRLRRLGDPDVVAKESPEVFRENTLLLLERFDLVKSVQSGKSARKANNADNSYAKALLGELPLDGTSDSEDEVAHG